MRAARPAPEPAGRVGQGPRGRARAEEEGGQAAQGQAQGGRQAGSEGAGTGGRGRGGRGRRRRRVGRRGRRCRAGSRRVGARRLRMRAGLARLRARRPVSHRMLVELVCTKEQLAPLQPSCLRSASPAEPKSRSSCFCLASRRPLLALRTGTAQARHVELCQPCTNHRRAARQATAARRLHRLRGTRPQRQVDPGRPARRRAQCERHQGCRGPLPRCACSFLSSLSRSARRVAVMRRAHG